MDFEIKGFRIGDVPLRHVALLHALNLHEEEPASAR